MPDQLRLFPAPRPLVERFSREFFRKIPEQPGVYLMEDGQGRIIYVGKAKNLRKRLCSYRYIKAETASRKSVRLVHSVERITWEILSSDLEAQIRENYLLRTLRPKFNRANVYPAAYCYVAFSPSNEGAELVITREHLNGFVHYGAFKNSVLFAMAALRRLIWLLQNKQSSFRDSPAFLRQERLTGNARFAIPSNLVREIEDYFSGKSPGILDHLQFCQPSSVFEQSYIAQDTEVLKNFFERCLVQTRQMKEEFQLSNQTIAPEILNDLLLRFRQLKQRH
ncbi:MAG: GIY-YIG nuclease family protein [Verrucomicrobia bacterium]|nr:GIY-YIG nuclease family protein [Verrucomicrobiota bacterium]